MPGTCRNLPEESREGERLRKSVFAEDLADLSTAQGTIRFKPDHPLPEPLVRRIVAARLAELA